MPFMVVYGTSDGSSRYEQAEAIDEAAQFVERLRNSEGIDKIQIYRMEEISFAFRPYYKVELGMPERQEPVPPADEALAGVFEAPVPPLSASVGVAGAEEPVTAVEPAGLVSGATTSRPVSPGLDDDAAGAAGRRGLFGR